MPSTKILAARKLLAAAKILLAGQDPFSVDSYDAAIEAVKKTYLGEEDLHYIKQAALEAWYGESSFERDQDMENYPGFERDTLQNFAEQLPEEVWVSKDGHFTENEDDAPENALYLDANALRKRAFSEKLWVKVSHG